MQIQPTYRSALPTRRASQRVLRFDLPGDLEPAIGAAAPQPGIGTDDPFIGDQQAQYMKFLHIPATVKPVVLLSVAYTIGDEFKPAKRPPVETITRWNRWIIVIVSVGGVRPSRTATRSISWSFDPLAIEVAVRVPSACNRAPRPVLVPSLSGLGTKTGRCSPGSGEQRP